MKLSRLSWVMLAVVSCRPGTTGPVLPGTDPCRIVSQALPLLDTITIAFNEREVETGRMVSRLSGKTLVRVDCQGRTRPSLAHRWTRDNSGTTWTFDLDSSVAASSVVAQWDLRRNGGLWPWNRILEVSAPAPGTLEVRLDTVFAEVPQALAIPELSIVAPPAPTAAIVRFQVNPSTLDQRDLLDRSTAGRVDLLITTDPGTIGYAGSKPGFTAVPLAWDRTYVVVAPTVRPELGPDLNLFKRSLVREVVRAESRVADGPAWWETSGCSGTTPLLPMGRRAAVVYLEGDQTAREIAERLVALQRTPVQTMALPRDRFVSSLAAGEASMYVLSLPRTDPGSCGRKPAWPSASSVLPLVDSRAHALVRAGVPGFTIEEDGTIRFDPVLRLIPRPSPSR